MEEPADLLEQAKAVLEINKHGDYTIPTEGLYTHQWLWDSCFISIGLRHYDIDRAQKEILSLLRGQWANGMLPNMIFAGGDKHRQDRNIWRSWLNPLAPDDVATSGITQPPIIAEAVIKIGEKLKPAERRTWYQQVFPAILAYHQWLYKERDPHDEGLVLLVHPWETGLDNTPPWMSELKQHQLPFWIRLATKKPLVYLVNRLRRDTRYVPADQRLSTFEALALYSVQHRLRRKAYDIDKILSHSLFAIEDLGFNSMLVRANHCLRHIAKAIHHELPDELTKKINKTEDALEMLWDGYTGQYYSRNFITHKLIKEPSIATLLPLYSGSVSKERAQQLIELLKDKRLFGAPYPVPSVPLNSSWFKSHSYWQGPVWINTNWLIIEGLKRYGFDEEAAELAQSTTAVVEKNGLYEYFSPIDGTPAGAHNFSWTASLVIDLIESYR